MDQTRLDELFGAAQNVQQSYYMDESEYRPITRRSYKIDRTGYEGVILSQEQWVEMLNESLGRSFDSLTSDDEKKSQSYSDDRKKFQSMIWNSGVSLD